MHRFEAHPTRGHHEPGRRVNIMVSTDGVSGGTVRANIAHLESREDVIEQPVEGPHTILTWRPPDQAPRSYGVDIELLDQSGSRLGGASTAFDVLQTWTQFPRYGFMCDFFPDRSELSAVIEDLARHHINGLQFYDWQYRHDRFIAPSDIYKDPLGRILSRTTLHRAVETAKSSGMAALAYAAIYAASAEFSKDRPGWALYDEEGEAHLFGADFLTLTNPARGGPWAKHLLDQCTQALGDTGFNGIHLDQYGEPRQAYDADGQPVDLPQAFTDLIFELKTHHPDASVTMNAVKGWPLDALAVSPQDFTYIELWPDTPTYRDLVEVVIQARNLAPKPVVVAVYIPAGRPSNVLAAEAVLAAVGASRIGLGEGRRLLTDPYFPNHMALPDDLERSLRSYHDLFVRYGELVGPIAQLTDDVTVQVRPPLWTTTHRNGSHLGISLVNLDLDLRWDRPHRMPTARRDIELAISGTQATKGVWWVTPDHPSPQPLQYTRSNGDLLLTVPSLDLWGMVILEAEGPQR